MNTCNLHPDWPCRGLDACGECQDWPSEECPHCGRRRPKYQMRPGADPQCEFCGLREDSSDSFLLIAFIRVLKQTEVDMESPDSRKEQFNAFLREGLAFLRELRYEE